MSLPTSLRAYEDCRKLFEAAIADPKGVRAKLDTYAACVQLRTRMNYFRSLDREANAVTYPADSPMHGESVYDPYVVQIYPEEGEGGWWVYVQPRDAHILAIESLSDVGDLVEVTAEEVHLIADQSEQANG